MSGQGWKVGDPIPVDAEMVEDDDDLDEHPITLPDGTLLDEAAAEAYGRDVADRAASKRGRPSLSGAGTQSPRLSVRLPEDVLRHFELYASLTGLSVSAIARQALVEFDAIIVKASAETDDEPAAEPTEKGLAKVTHLLDHRKSSDARPEPESTGRASVS